MSESPLDVVDARAAAVAVAPRITKDMIENEIVQGTYFTGDEVVPNDVKVFYSHFTMCMLRMSNGFIVIGKSAPMDPANFNAELGRNLAYEDAFRQLWPLYAFAHLEDTRLFKAAEEAATSEDD